jgi:hypothetical protein
MSNRVYARVRPKRPSGLLFILFSLSLYFHFKNKYARDEIEYGFCLACEDWFPIPPDGRCPNFVHHDMALSA